MVVTQKDQVVTGETAVFDTKANLITMLGGVVLTQCKNVLRGDRLMVDMTTGVSRVESDSGKVQGLFIQSGQGCGRKRQARRRRYLDWVTQVNQNNINHLFASRILKVDARRARPVLTETARRCGPCLESRVFRWARDIQSFMLRERIVCPQRVAG